MADLVSTPAVHAVVVKRTGVGIPAGSYLAGVAECCRDVNLPILIPAPAVHVVLVHSTAVVAPGANLRGVI